MKTEDIVEKIYERINELTDEKANIAKAIHECRRMLRIVTTNDRVAKTLDFVNGLGVKKGINIVETPEG